MLLKKIFHFARGYVILTIEGKKRDETLRKLVASGVEIRSVTHSKDKITMELCPKDFLQLDELKAYDGVCVVKQGGVGYTLKRLKRHKIFAAGVVIFLAVFAVGSQFIWTVEYEGTENCDKAVLEDAARLAGIYRGALKCRLKSGIEMKNIIMNNTDNVCWAWVYIKGTAATVRVRTGIIPKDTVPDGVPCDIIAARSGLIKDITALKGRRMAEKNMYVAPGDVLISGNIDFEDTNGYQVHSRGEVTAYTSHEKTGVFKQYYCYKTYTGRKRRFLTLSVFGRDLPLYIKKRVGFESYDEYERTFRDICGVHLKLRRCDEYETEKEPIPYETAVEFAREKLERDISRELLPGSELVDRHVEVKQIDGETLSVTVIMEFIENIGTQRSTEEVDFIEPKTNQPAG